MYFRTLQYILCRRSDLLTQLLRGDDLSSACVTEAHTPFKHPRNTKQCRTACSTSTSILKK